VVLNSKETITIILPKLGHELVKTHFTFKYPQPRWYFDVLIDLLDNYSSITFLSATRTQLIFLSLHECWIKLLKVFTIHQKLF